MTSIQAYVVDESYKVLQLDSLTTKQRVYLYVTLVDKLLVMNPIRDGLGRRRTT
jgi:hypothetical protein